MNYKDFHPTPSEISATIALAKTYVSTTITNQLSSNTLIDYNKKYESLLSLGGFDGIWDAAKNTKKTRTYYARRAAILHVSKIKLGELLAEIDALREAKNFATPENMRTGIVAPYLEKNYQLLSIVRTIQKTPGPAALLEREPRSSKRRTKNASDNWREVVCSRMLKWKPQFLTMAVTGCRPCELLNGVDLHIAGGDFVAQFLGAKVTDYSGQPHRTMKWSVDNTAPIIRALVDLTRAAGGKTTIKITGTSKRPAAVFSIAIRDAAKRAFPRLNNTITCYSLRHALASDMKAANFSKVQIAQALGHISINTQATYGHINAARGASLAPREVDAAREVHGTSRSMPDFSEPRISRESP